MLLIKFHKIMGFRIETQHRLLGNIVQHVRQKKTACHG